MNSTLCNNGNSKCAHYFNNFCTKYSRNLIGEYSCNECLKDIIQLLLWKDKMKGLYPSNLYPLIDDVTLDNFKRVKNTFETEIVKYQKIGWDVDK